MMTPIRPILLLSSLSFLLVAPGLAGVSKHVLVIGIDGCRPDALQAASTPNMDGLIAGGVVTYDAFAGGSSSAGDPTHQATSSGPGWSSICTGVWVDKHGVSSNGNFSSGNFLFYPHFFKRVRNADPGSYLSSIVQWHPINQNLLVPYAGLADFIQNVADSGQAVENATLAHLQSADPTVLFLHFDDVDHAGHGSGYSPGVPAYIQAIEETDAHIGNILNALELRPNHANEDWLVIVTTDHGGIGGGHGGHSTEERQIFLIVSGGETPDGVVVSEGPGHTAVPPTSLKHLGIPLNPTFGFESEPFGLPDDQASAPVPADGAQSVAQGIEFSWFMGADAVAYDIYLGTQSSLGASEFQGQQAGTSFDPGGLGSEQVYYWRVDTVTNLGTVTGEVWSFETVGDTLDEQVVAFDFEGDLIDNSGHHNDGLAFGGPGYTTGASGQALNLVGNGAFVSMGNPSDLDFGSNVDFTVALWVNASGWSSDPVLVSNKNWVSGSNTGWILAMDPNGTHWQWNFCGASGTRRDYDAAGNVGDGAWHQIVVSHDRDGDARFYQDGVYIGLRSIAGQGNIDSGMPTAVGEDGTLNYGVPLAASLDGLQIWRRTLGDSEVTELYLTGARTYVGTGYCSSNPNSTGAAAEILSSGSVVLAETDFLLSAVHLPPGVPGLFFTGQLQVSLPFGDGLRCVGGQLTRLGSVLYSTSAGVATLDLDFGSSQTAGLFQPGASWNFQYWFRDVPAQMAGFNLTDGLNLTWQ